MARPRRSQGTRELLLTEGLAVLNEKGYHGTGLQEVLSRAGVPKGSFYNYFVSKEEFGAEVIRAYAADFDARLEETVGQAEKDAAGALRTFFARLIAAFEDGGCVGGCLVGNLGAELEENEFCRTAIVEALAGWRSRLKVVIALGQQQRGFRDDRSPAELADLVLNSWEGAVLRMKIDRSPKPLQLFLRIVVDETLRY